MLATRPNKEFRFDLPDPVGRKELEYYRDHAKRGYLSYLVPPGHGPSLFFKQPGLTERIKKKGAASVINKAENKMW